MFSFTVEIYNKTRETVHSNDSTHLITNISSALDNQFLIIFMQEAVPVSVTPFCLYSSIFLPFPLKKEREKRDEKEEGENEGVLIHSPGNIVWAIVFL